MKKLILLGFFLVTWDQYYLEGHNKDHPDWDVNYDYYTVEVETATTVLATQKDVDLFVGYKDRKIPGKQFPLTYLKDTDGVIHKMIFSEPSTLESREGFVPRGAFNVRVEAKP